MVTVPEMRSPRLGSGVCACSELNGSAVSNPDSSNLSSKPGVESDANPVIGAGTSAVNSLDSSGGRESGKDFRINGFITVN